ncbi:hypothetical protein J7E82_06595 [Arthrobacter sp. ISL-30]|nr:hypothetical protein [Arthrobacter sp. ISL-30]
MRARRVALAAAVVLALSGAGAATVWAASADAPSPLPSSSATPTPDSGKPGKGNQKSQDAKAQDQKSQDQKWQDAKAQDQKAQDGKARRGEHLHGENVVKRPDGTVLTFLTQKGSVESVSESSITVKSEDGFSQSYAINADTRLFRIPAGAGGSGATGSAEKDAAGNRPKPNDVKATDLKAGDVVRVAGTKEGDTVTAIRVVAGDLPANAKGPGGHFGKGWLNGQGQGGGPKASDSPPPAP